MESPFPDTLNQLGEAHLRLILGQLPAYLWTTDTDLRLTAFRGAGFAGREAEIRGRLGLTLHEFFGTDDPLHEPITAHCRALAGESAGYEIRLYEREFKVRVEPLRDEQGAIIGCLGLGHDVTEQKRLEAALRASEARWRALFQALPVGVVLADRDRRVIACNPAYERLVGYREAELRGRRFPLATHPDDAGPDMVLFRALMAGEYDQYRLEKRYVHHQGREVWGRLTARRLLDGEGSADQALGLVEDITELQALRDTLRRLLTGIDTLADDAENARARLDPAGTDLDRPDLSASPYRHARPRGVPGEPSAPLPHLTARERLLLLLLDQGKGDKEIARLLNIAASTARKNLSGLYGKLGVHSRGEAVAWARHNGVVGDA